MRIRILTVVALIIGAFIAPWWAVALGCVLCVVAYRRFVEALIPALIIDVLYGAHPVVGVPGSVTAAMAALIVISFFIESSIRGHVRI